MNQQYFLGLLVLLACFCSEGASRPSNNESSSDLKVEVPMQFYQPSDNEERALPEDERPFEMQEAQEENTKEILDKIKVINNKLKKPQRQQINYNAPPFISGGYILDKAILEKIQQIIASGKLSGLSSAQKIQAVNSIASEVKDSDSRDENSRALRFVPQTITNNDLSGNSIVLVPIPYVTQYPVVVMPTASVYPVSNDINTLQSTAEYSTRQRPSLPFQIQWPLAPFFPVLIKDPLLHYLQGGTWENLVDYGQNADVCNRKQKSADETTNDDKVVAVEDSENIQNDLTISLDPVKMFSSRQGRKVKNIKKRTVSKSAPAQSLTQKQIIAKASAFQPIQNVKNLQNLFKPTPKPKPTKKPVLEVDEDETDLSAPEGDLRFPFGDFTWMGNRKPIAPSPGFFINRLKVRRGGVAIAGPGGVATAGRGGTAVVGPGGLAYTQPGGLAVAGPQARVVALSSDTDLNSIVNRLQQLQQSAQDSSVPRLLQATPEGKVVATGPVIYYHPYTS